MGNKTGTLPFERNVLAIMANFDLAVVISLKSQNYFKTCRGNHFISWKQWRWVNSVVQKEIPKKASRQYHHQDLQSTFHIGSFLPTIYDPNNLASSIHCYVHTCTFVIFME